MNLENLLSSLMRDLIIEKLFYFKLEVNDIFSIKHRISLAFENKFINPVGLMWLDSMIDLV